MTILYLCGVYWATFLELLYVKLLILRKISVNKACQGVTVSPNSNISILVVKLVNDLLRDPIFCLSLVVKCISIGLLQIFLYLLCLVPVKLLPLRLRLHVLLIFVVLFWLPYLSFMLLFKLQVFLHGLVHVLIVNINIDHLFSLL